jgi:hypothetical protein
VCLAAMLAVALAPAAHAQTVEPPFAGSYSFADIGSPPGVPASLGGLTLKAGTTDRLLIGGSANSAAGALYEIGLTRDGAGHITGFSGTATRVIDAAYNDGGVTYGPGGVLFLARWPANQLGQTRPGSAITDKVIDLGPLAVASSLASLQFVPAGQPGASSLKLASYSGGQWYDAAVTPDGSGTYNVGGVTAMPNSTLSGGPEGFVYVTPGSPQFGAPSLLVSEYGAGNVGAYQVDANGDPVIATRRTFISGLTGAEGAFLDPLTGDFLFSTFGGGSRVIVVRGFAPSAAALRVAVRVVNDNGGTRGDFPVHVTQGGADVAGSPRSGDASYALAPGTYTVAAEPAPRYAASIAGDCAPDGTVAMQTGLGRTCIVTYDDIAVLPSPGGQLLPPVAGQTVNALPASGTVRIRLPGTSRFVVLQAGQQIPVGTIIDTTKGRVTLVAAADRQGGTAQADFYDGIFKLGQTKAAKPVTTLDLVEKLSCGRAKRATAAARKKKKRQLWGDGKGRFRTDGEFSSATVRGTRWLTQDRCDSTLTKVARGSVSVRDFVKRRTVVVRAGRQYVAKRRR